MRHDNTPLQVFAVGVPEPRPGRPAQAPKRREHTVPLTSAHLPPPTPAPVAVSSTVRASAPAAIQPWHVQLPAPAGTRDTRAFDPGLTTSEWVGIERAYDRPLARLWRAFLRLFGITRR